MWLLRSVIAAYAAPTSRGKMVGDGFLGEHDRDSRRSYIPGKIGGDAFDKFLDEQVARKPTSAIEVQLSPTPTPPVNEAKQISYEFPKVRSDSIWPFVIRFMESKSTWRVDELISFAKQHTLVTTDSALRSALSSLKSWDFLENDTPGQFSLKPKGFAYLSTLKPNQFVLGGAAETTHSENNV